ncbi:hypothetical protein [Pseudomonas lactis]|uniref:hypothetical protein n=1 Tax=Pseudomonas lactis TaxID=1615674 RepID=UPI00117F86E3|nr:hypothetical protein [Pseudomonas lactis]
MSFYIDRERQTVGTLFIDQQAGVPAYAAKAALPSRAKNIRLTVSVINAGKKAPKRLVIYY